MGFSSIHLTYPLSNSQINFAGSGEAGSRTDAKVHPLWNWPNAISMARLVSGPGIGYLILQSQWQAAFIGLAVSGVQLELAVFLVQ